MAEVSDGKLVVDFASETSLVEPGESLTFGRDADLSIDDNNYLHRKLGMFEHQGQLWQLHNVGSAIELSVLDRDSANSMSVLPGTASPLPYANALVRFSAGRTQYELEIRIEGFRPAARQVEAVEGAQTITPAAAVDLTDEQRLLLVALAQFRLRDRGAPQTAIPMNKDAMEQLGWSRAKYNRKLDLMCTKFAEAGVTGLVGKPGSLAKLRRERLIDYVLVTRIITEDDLNLLEAHHPEGG